MWESDIHEDISGRHTHRLRQWFVRSRYQVAWQHGDSGLTASEHPGRGSGWAGHATLPLCVPVHEGEETEEYHPTDSPSRFPCRMRLPETPKISVEILERWKSSPSRMLWIRFLMSVRLRTRKWRNRTSFRKSRWWRGMIRDGVIIPLKARNTIVSESILSVFLCASVFLSGAGMRCISGPVTFPAGSARRWGRWKGAYAEESAGHPRYLSSNEKSFHEGDFKEKFLSLTW